MEEIGIDMLMLFYYTAVAIIRGSFRSVQLGGRRQQVYLFSKLFGDRLMVGQQVLVLFIGVRVPVPEQSISVKVTRVRQGASLKAI